MGVRTVVVGYGRAGRSFHCYLVGLTPGLDLYGVVSGSPEKRTRVVQDHECRAFSNLGEACADPDVDLVVLATPNSSHCDLAVQAMDAGKHVVTDKVMCLTLTECDRMVAASARNGVMLSVFQNRRFDGDFRTVRKLVCDGELGSVKWVEMAWQGFGAWGGWRAKAAMGGGKLYDLGAHLVDQLCLLFPDPVDHVYCRMHHDYDHSEVESEALVVVTFAGGQTGVCDFSSMAAISKPRFYVRGTKGTFSKYGLDPQEAAMSNGDIDGAVESPDTYGVFSDGKSERTIPTLPGRWRDYYENVADVLLKGGETAVKLPELRRQIAVLDAARRSAGSGEVVRPGRES